VFNDVFDKVSDCWTLVLHRTIRGIALKTLQQQAMQKIDPLEGLSDRDIQAAIRKIVVLA
jgi:hypothetical protein